MNQENRQCQNCKGSFTIEPDDFVFYERIKVPPPTWCPDCRFQRRLMWRNERILYKRKCGLCEKGILSNRSPDKPFVIYCPECWWSDRWDPLPYGRDYDFKLPFFEQFWALMGSVPQLSLWAVNNTNANFSNYVTNNKNLYFSFSTLGSENIFYSYFMVKDKDCFDCYRVNESVLCYENIFAIRNYDSYFLINCRDCIKSGFLFDCVNCQNCFLSANLRNKQFFIRNRAYTKEDYFKELEKLQVGSHLSLEKIKGEFDLMVSRKSIHKFTNILKSVNVTGDHIVNSKNVHDSFFVDDGENARYCWIAVSPKDSYDVSGLANPEFMYESQLGGTHGYMNKFYSHSDNSSYTDYVHFCTNSSHLFGCIGLRNKSYCILNKQFTKEEYEALVPRIIEHMNKRPYVDSKGRIYRYGEFFPPELSPFAYNETVAQEYFPLSEAEAKSKGYRWKDPDPKAYTITKKPEDLPDHIKDVTDDILKETIGCAHAVISDNPRLDQRSSASCNHQCTTAFKIIPEELQFYRRMNLPLPRLCPNCRHCERLKQRNPLKLWHRQCQCAGAKSENGTYQNTVQHSHGVGKCPNEFETSYAPDRKEIVYCESCYNSEVV